MSFKSNYFTSLDPDVTLVNHGSFGTTPTCVLEKQIEISKAHERYPDAFYALEAEALYKKQISALSKYLGIDSRNLALVTNATTGVNTVLRSIPWDFGHDKVLLHSTSYKACANTVQFLSDYYNLGSEVIQLDYPLEDEELLARFEEKLATGSFRLCMFDMISSMPGVVLPYERLVQLCHKYNVLSLIDGAHAAGLLDLHFLDTLQPDYFTTNLHKWMSAPKSCGLLYVNPKHHATIQSLPISWNYSAEACQPIQDPKTDAERLRNDSIMHNKFCFVGTASYSQYFCIEEAIRFRQEDCGGEEKIRAQQWELQRTAIPIVVSRFGPGAMLLQNSTGTLTSPGMFNVNMPFDDKYAVIKSKLASEFHYFRRFKQRCDTIMLLRKAYAPFTFHNGQLWVRFSVQLFNEPHDYEAGADSVKAAVLQVLDEELAAL